MKGLTIQQFFKKFSSDDVCLEHIMKQRYGLQGTCMKCNKETKYHRVKSQRAYVCQFCGWHFYPCVDTPFENSRTSLQLWFYAIYLFTTTRNGVSAKELQRQLGVTYKCAWRVGHEIRKYMSEIDGDELLGDCVEVDEGYTHKTVNHGIGEYAKGDLHVNSIEVFWSMLKRGINGTHIHVSKKHMEKYVKEFEYRFNSRQCPALMFDELLSSFEKPSKK